jgi:probable F420-dependent oxidoreductase
MKLDAAFPVPLREMGGFAASLESAGYAGLWTTDTPHEPFMPLLAAALTTETMTLGTGIATAFTRSPMITALTAWDLQAASRGRFVLGLGTQVKAHNARRYSTPVESPGRQLRELIGVLRHIWGVFQDEHPLDFHGDFYDLDLFTPMHSPGPIDHPDIPIYLAAVGPYTYRLAGELADGIHVHSFNTPEHLRSSSIPALEEGLARSGRERSDVTLVCSVFTVVGDAPEADRVVRAQIAFYGSTSAYRPVFETHGWGDLTDRLKEPVRAGDVDGMAALIDDDVVEAFAIVAPDWPAAARRIRERYDGLLDRISVYSLQGMADPGDAPEIAAAFAA